MSSSSSSVSSFDVFFLVYNYLRQHFPSTASSLERESKSFNLPLNDLCSVHKPLSLYAILTDYCRLKTQEIQLDRLAQQHGQLIGGAVKQWMKIVQTVEKLSNEQIQQISQENSQNNENHSENQQKNNEGKNNENIPIPALNSHSALNPPLSPPSPAPSPPLLSSSSFPSFPRSHSLSGVYSSSEPLFTGALNIDIDSLGLEQLVASSIPALIAEKINHLESLKQRPNENAQAITLTEREIEELSMQLISDPIAAPLIDQAFLFQTENSGNFTDEAALSSYPVVQQTQMNENFFSSSQSPINPRKRGNSGQLLLATPIQRPLTRSRSPVINRTQNETRIPERNEPSTSHGNSNPNSIEELVKRFKAGNRQNSSVL
jgi:hypothetical protein